MPKVTAAQFQKQFGTYSETAQRTPVTITKHGRDSLVVLSASAYERLKSFDTREAYSVFDLPDDIAEALLNATAPEWTAKYDHEMDEAWNSPNPKSAKSFNTATSGNEKTRKVAKTL
jgi:prevent-host-death family protein